VTGAKASVPRRRHRTRPSLAAFVVNSSHDGTCFHTREQALLELQRALDNYDRYGDCDGANDDGRHPGPSPSKRVCSATSEIKTITAATPRTGLLTGVPQIQKRPDRAS